MNVYDPQRIAREIAALTLSSPDTTAKGRQLQDLAEYLLGQIDGLTIVARNFLNRTKSEEKDLWAKHQPYVSGLPFADVLFPVECKNEKRRTSAAEIRDFEAKIRDSGGHDGLLITATGLSGHPEDRAHSAVAMALSRGIRITVVTAGDLSPLATSADLVGLLVDRFTELRVVQGYNSI
jgi:hypothetical protein